MKVCTDSCLFGAWVASRIESVSLCPKTILDIGTGTGLLSLMLAQKSNASIDAVEIDTNAFEQATENISASPWKERISLFNIDIKKWNTPLKYDLIISNPPFYENDLLPEDDGRNISKHSAALNLEQLLFVVKKLLSNDGMFAVLLPWHRTAVFENLAMQHSLFIKEKLDVRQTTAHNYFRTILLFQNHETITSANEMSIKDDNDQYSTGFRNLLKDYYLHL